MEPVKKWMTFGRTMEKKKEKNIEISNDSSFEKGLR